MYRYVVSIAGSEVVFSPLMSLPDEILGKIFTFCTPPTWEALGATSHRLYQICKITQNVDVVASRVFENPSLYNDAILSPHLLENKTIVICAITKDPSLVFRASFQCRFKNNSEIMRTAFVAAHCLKKQDIKKKLLDDDISLLGLEEEFRRSSGEDGEEVSASLSRYLPFLLHSSMVSIEDGQITIEPFKRVLSVSRDLCRNNPRFFPYLDSILRGHKELVLEVLRADYSNYAFVEHSLHKDPAIRRAYLLGKEKENGEDLRGNCESEGECFLRPKKSEKHLEPHTCGRG